MELSSRHIINNHQLGQVASTIGQTEWSIQGQPIDQVATKRIGFFDFDPIQ